VKYFDWICRQLKSVLPAGSPSSDVCDNAEIILRQSACVISAVSPAYIVAKYSALNVSLSGSSTEEYCEKADVTHKKKDLKNK
jgi:hypothetical protein